MSPELQEEKPPASLAEAIVMVQANLPTVKKDKTAQVPTKGGDQFSYSYADLASVSEALYPVITKYGLSFIAKPTLNAEGRFVLAYVLRHVTDEAETGEYPLPDPAHTPPQQLGSAITYARRYSFCSVLGVVPDEDDDGNLAQQSYSSNRSTKPKAKQPVKPARADEADKETGEVPEPPNVSAAIKRLDQEGRKELEEKRVKANFPAVDKLAPAAAKQMIKWAEELLAKQDAGAPFE